MITDYLVILILTTAALILLLALLVRPKHLVVKFSNGNPADPFASDACVKLLIEYFIGVCVLEGCGKLPQESCI